MEENLSGESMRIALCVQVILLSAAMACSPAWAGQKAVGVVSQADRAHIGSTNALTGSNVYNCENLETEDQGEMRVQVRSSQVYLAASSMAQIEQDANEVQVFVNRGTVGFSSPAGGGVELTTPAGFIRAASGQAASGQVTITNGKEMLVSAIRGDLVLDNGGEFRTIAQGQTVKITFNDGLEPVCRVDEAGNQPRDPVVHHQIGFYIVAAAAVGGTSAIIWHKIAESDYKPQ